MDKVSASSGGSDDQGRFPSMAVQMVAQDA